MWKKLMWRSQRSPSPCSNITCNVFLMGLNNSFSQIHTQLLLVEPEPTLQKALSLVV